MRYQFEIKGLDCANCALELERQIQKIEGIKDISINFIGERLLLECEESNREEVIKKVKKVVRREEPDCELKQL